MRIFIPLLLFFVWDYASGGLTVQNCGKRTVAQGRIYGGTESRHGDYPWMVSIQQKGYGDVCGGSIINENWILTAAHCFDDPDGNNDLDTKNFAVLVGLHKQSEKKGPTVQRLQISKIVKHELYKEEDFSYDIAAIKTEKPINIKGSKGYVNGICLPPSASTPSGNGTVIGWGYTEAGEDAEVDTLREITIPIIEWKKCKEIYEAEDSEYELPLVPTMVCAGDPDKDTCQGDSGGPFFQFDKSGTAILIGVVANGGDCFDRPKKHYPGVYMKVTAFKSWMEKVMI